MSEKLLLVGDKLLLAGGSILTLPVDESLQEKTVTPTEYAQIVAPDAGYSGLNKVTVEGMPKTTQATPTIEVDSSGLITASTTQTAGYVSAGTKSATEQLSIQEAQTIVPGTTDKTIEAGKYLTGIQTIKGDANLVPENIAKDVTLFGIPGTHQSGEDVTAELAEQESLIDQIQLALQGKGSVKAFAAIGVTYPEGSTCTCSNGTKTLSAKDTSGQALFLVPGEGEWTITSVSNDGKGNTASKVVEITEEGQCVSESLFYGLYLFTEGVGVADGYGINLGHDGSGGSIAPDGIVWSTNNGIGNQVWVSPQVDVSEYKRLCVELICDTRNAASYSVAIGIGVNPPNSAAQPNDWVASTSGIWSTERDIYSVDVSSIQGSYYIKLAGYATTGTIFNIWLDNSVPSELPIFKSGEGAKVVLSTSLEDSQCYVNIGTDKIDKGWQSNNRTSAFSTDVKYDLTNYNTLEIEYTCSDVGASGYNESFGVSTTKVSTGTTASNLNTKSKAFISTASRTTDTIDISELTGEFYIGVCGSGKSSIYNLCLIS